MTHPEREGALNKLRRRFFPPPPAATVPAAVAESPEMADNQAEFEAAAKLRPEKLYAAGREKLNWQEKFLVRLTPLHLAVSGDVPDDDPIAARLRLHAANLCVLYLADRTERGADGNRLVAIFAGARGQVKMELADFSADSPRGSGAEVSALVDLVVWAYGRSFGGDRLTLVQNTVARALAGCPQASCFERLLRRGASLREEIKAGWKLFMEGRLEEFMGQVQALEEEVASTAQAFSDQTSAMIKSLSDTALAAIGVALGTFIAALVKEGFESEILVLGFVLYVLYLIVFPLTYNMSQRRQSYRELEARFQRRRERFEERLTREKVGKIVGSQVTDSQERFQRWFVRTGITYLLVVAVMVVTLIAGWNLFVDAPPLQAPPRAPWH